LTPNERERDFSRNAFWLIARSESGTLDHSRYRRQAMCQNSFRHLPPCQLPLCHRPTTIIHTGVSEVPAGTLVNARRDWICSGCATATRPPAKIALACWRGRRFAHSLRYSIMTQINFSDRWGERSSGRWLRAAGPVSRRSESIWFAGPRSEEEWPSGRRVVDYPVGIGPVVDRCPAGAVDCTTGWARKTILS